MVIVSANKICKSYGIEPVLKDVSFSIESGDKIGLLGVNGAGKTTLFKILTRQLEPDGGEVHLSKNLDIAYMEQHSEFSSEKTAVDETMSVFSDLMDMERRLETMQHQLEASPSDGIIKRHAELQERYIADGGLTYKARVRSTLLGLGFLEEELSLPLSSISGGQRTRALLAKLLLGEPDILLLDEPTNHLDLKAITWLEGFLSEYKGTLVVISHDRYFLDKVVNRIFELENKKLTTYKGNYEKMAAQKAQIRLTMEREYANKEKEIKRLQGIVEQQKQWNRQKNLVTAHSKEKVIARIEATMEKVPNDPKQIGFCFGAAPASGDEVLTLKGISKAFDGRSLFHDVNILLKRGEKAILIGDNGCGKTTLFRIILGKIAADSGSVIKGANVKVGYYDQAQSDLMPHKTIMEVMNDALPHIDNGQIRNALAAFLFTGDDVFKKISDLSGGERARIALARLMLGNYNLLLMDEPTNHLDIASKEVLEQALTDYDGTLFAVSHDRYFINKLANRIYALSGSGIDTFAGDYNDYLEKITAREEARPGKKEKQPNDYIKKKQQASEINRLRGRVTRMEAEIEKLEEDMETLSSQMESPDIASDFEKITELSKQINEQQLILSDCYAQWEEMTERLDVLMQEADRD